MANVTRKTGAYKQAADSMRNAFGGKPADKESEEDEEGDEESSFASKITSGLDKLRRKGPPARKGY